MTQTITPTRNSGLMPKVIFLGLSVIVVVAIVSGMLFYGFNNATGQVRSVAQISGNFGKPYGITDLNQIENKARSGVASTTLDFNIVGAAGTPLNYSVDYIAKALKSVENPGIVNIVTEGISSDNKEKFALSYYATSEEDYKGEEFSKVNRIVTDLTELNTGEVKVISEPAENGGRSNEIEIHANGAAIDSPNFTNLWREAVSIIEKQKNVNEGNTYKLTLVTDEAEDSGFAKVKVEAFMYNEELVATAKEIDALMWSTLTAYSTPKGGFSFLNAQEVTYVISPKPTASKVTIVMAGAQPDAPTVDTLVTTFRTEAYKKENVYFGYSYVTALKYAENPDDAYTEYSSNIIY
jgi:hypothetical protein